MAGSSSDEILELDEIDREILEILSSDPRRPYSDISSELAESDIELSSESVRRRVTELYQNMTSFFLPRPNKHDWEIVLVTVTTGNGAGAKKAVFERMSEMNFWFIANGFGTIDIYGIATAESNEDIDELLVQVQGIDGVREVDHFIETERSVNIGKYLRVF